MRRLSLCILLISAAAGLGASSAARAEPGPRGQVLKLRSTGLFAHWESINLKGLDNLALPILGPSASLEIDRSYVLEVGGDWLLGLQSTGYDAYLRAGWIWGAPESGGRPTNTTLWDSQLVTLVGYRYTKRPPIATSDGYKAYDYAHCVTATGGLDITRWGRGNSGFSMRIYVGGSLVLSSKWDRVTWEYVSADPMTFSVELGISLGMALDLGGLAD